VFESLYYIKLADGVDQTTLYPLVTKVTQEYPSLDGYFQARCTNSQVYNVRSHESVVSVTSVKEIYDSGTEDSTRTIVSGRTSKPWDFNTVPGDPNNPGLIRHTSDLNPYETEDGTYTKTFTQPNYVDGNGANITVDGTGVDFVILSGGMVDVTDTEYHTNSVSRIQQFDWNTLNNVSGVSVDYVNATQGSHAKAVLAIACSNTYGWATGAHIYILDRAQVDDLTCLTTLKEFHTQKTNGRPTVVVGSFSYKRETTKPNKSQINFRGTDFTTYSGIDLRKQSMPEGEITSFGLKKTILNGQGGENNNDNRDFDAIASAAQLLNNSGVITVYSAGNNANKLEVANGIDWNNAFTENDPDVGVQTLYYNRGSAQWATDSIVVGNLSTEFDTYLPNQEVISTTSGRGPRVDTYAIGGSFKILLGSSEYNIAGTSFSAPQVAGMACLVAQRYPTTTPYQMRRYFRDYAVSSANLYTGKTSVTTDLADFGDPQYFMDGKAIQGSKANIAYINSTVTGDPTVLYSTNTNTYKHTSNLLWTSGALPWHIATQQQDEDMPGIQLSGLVYNGTGNSRSIDTGPKGNQEIVWNMINTVISSETRQDGDGGWNHSHNNRLSGRSADLPIPIDNSKTYRFSVWIRRKNVGTGTNRTLYLTDPESATTNHTYFGLFGLTAEGETSASGTAFSGLRNPDYYNFGISHRNTGDPNPTNFASMTQGNSRPYSTLENPYFYQGFFLDNHDTEGEWFLFVGHVHPRGSSIDTQGGTMHNDSGIYNTSGVKVEDINYDFVWNGGDKPHTHTLHRCMLYYSETLDVHQQAWEPRIDDLTDPDCPTVAELITLPRSGYDTGIPAVQTWDTHSSTRDASNLLWQNFADWDVGTKSTGGYRRDGDDANNRRIITDTPYGQDIVWDTPAPMAGWDSVAVSGRHEGYGVGGFTSSWFNIDNTKKYRASIWVRRPTHGTGNWYEYGAEQSGTFYFGPNRSYHPDPNINWYVDSHTPPYPHLVKNRGGDSGVGNPYAEYNINWSEWGHLNADSPGGAANDWFLVVFHMHPANSGIGLADPESGVYNANGDYIVNLYPGDYMFNPNQTQTNIRSFVVYCRNEFTSQQLYAPRFDDLSHPNCPSLTDLFSYNPESYAYKAESPIQQSLTHSITEIDTKLRRTVNNP